MKPKLRLYYVGFKNAETAIIENSKGYYICEIKQTYEEKKKRFRKRARAFLKCLEESNYSFVHGGDLCP